MKYIDRTGKQYGSLIAENKAPGGKWVCLCLLCIDRVDSSIGYIVSNCVACCSQCNYAKRTAPAEQFLQWVKRVYEHCIAEKRCE